LTSAIFTPLGHIAVKGDFIILIVLFSIFAPMITSGVLITKSWIEQRFQRSLTIAAVTYGIAMIAAILSGIS
jgi:hypothetical protein